MQPVVKKLLRLALRSLALCTLWLFWLWLCAAAAIQIHFLTASDYSLPRPLVRIIRHQLAQNDIHFSFSAATLEPDGALFIENPTFTSATNTASHLATARFLYAKIDIGKLFIGRLDIREVIAGDFRLNLPAMLSDSGQDEPVLDKTDLHLVASHERVEILYLAAAINNLRLHADGAFVYPELLDFSLLPTTKSTFLQTYVKNLRKVARHTAYLGKLENPTLHIQLIPDPAEIATLSATFRADSLDNPPGTFFPIRAGNLVSIGQAPLRQAADGALLQVTASAERIEIQASSSVPEVHFHRTTAALEFYAAPLADIPLCVLRQLKVSSARIHSPARKLTLGAFSAHIGLTDDDRLVTHHAALQLADSQVSLAADIDLSSTIGTARLDARLGNGFLSLVDTQTLLPVELARLIEFPAADKLPPLSIAVFVKFNRDWMPEFDYARLHSGPVRVHNVDLAEAAARITLNGDQLLCDQLLLRTEGSSATGLYEMDIADHRFRFLLAGHLYPQHISGWFGEWWPNLWTRFDFPHEAPEATISIAGQWNTDTYHKLYLSVDAARPTVHGQALDHAHARMTIDPGAFVNVGYLHANLAGRTAQGSFKLLSDDADKDWERVTFAIKTNFDPVNISQLVAQTTDIPIVNAIRFEQAPDITAIGNYNITPLEGTLCGSLRAAGNTYLRDIPLENITLNATGDGNIIDIPDLRARFADGDLAANLRITETENTHTLALDGTLESASLAQLQTILVSTRKATPSKQAAPEENWTPEDTLSISAKITTPLTDTDHIQGTAHAAVSSPQLAKINLLGGLSELLRGTFLNIGGIDFTQLETDITLDNNHWTFANTRITGPSSRIEAYGAANIATERLNLRVKLYPLKETKTLVSKTLGVLLTPFTQMLEVKLQGTFNNPRWFFASGPTSLIQNLGSDDPDLPQIPEDQVPQVLRKPRRR